MPWKEIPSQIKVLVAPFELPQPHHNFMQIALSCPAGSATTEVQSQDVCPLMLEVENSLPSPKARDAFRFYKETINCLRTPAAKQ